MTALLNWEPLERPGQVFAVIGAMFLVAYLAAVLIVPRAHGRIVNGDAIQYYAYLRSLIIDHDLDFTNDYEAFYPPDADDRFEGGWLTGRTATGRLANMVSIGPALLWAPFFVGTYLVLVMLRMLGIYVPLDGLAAPFQASTGVAGVIFATVGAYFCYRSCRLLFPAAPALWGALVAWLATPAVYYSVVSPTYSHAPSLFATALFVYVWLRTRDSYGILRFVWLGLLAGVAALMRWQDVIILALPGCELLSQSTKRRLPFISVVVRGMVMAVAVAFMFAPQLVAWRAIYGEFLVMPQGGGFMRWSAPAVVSVLFSLRQGLFTWTPAVLVCIAGLGFLVRRDRLLGCVALAIVALTIYVNACAGDWWAGAAFGARRFVGNTILFSMGLAALFASEFSRRRPRLVPWTAAALILYNLLFVLQYQLFMRGFEELAPYPSTVKQVFFDRLVLPFALVRAWLSGP